MEGRNSEWTKASLPASEPPEVGHRCLNKKGRVFFDSLENGTGYYQVRVTWYEVKVSVWKMSSGSGAGAGAGVGMGRA